MIDKSVYEENGYLDREHYLQSLSEEYDISLDDVIALSDILGPPEDFDGLIVTLQDYSEEF